MFSQLMLFDLLSKIVLTSECAFKNELFPIAISIGYRIKFN